MAKLQKAGAAQFAAVQNKKYILEAYAQWLINHPMVFVSVMDEAGQPVKGLKKANFHAARIGNGGAWVQLTITSIQTEGNEHGFYGLSIQKDTLGNQLMNWNFFPDQILTIEVTNSSGAGSNKINFRGQCLAAMQTKAK